MRQPIRKRKHSNDWLVSGGLTALFVAGSLWYLGFLPSWEELSDNWQTAQHAEEESATDREQTTSKKDLVDQMLTDSEGADRQSSFAESQSEPKPEMRVPEQFEPATDSDVSSDSSEPVQTVTAQPPLPTPQPELDGTASKAAPTPPFEDSSPSRPTSLSEQERIARIFGETPPQTNPQRSTQSANEIVPTSAEKPAAAKFPLEDGSFQQIDQWIRDGQILKAHKALSKRYWQEDDPLEPLLTRLNKTAGMIYFASQPHFMTACEVQPGDLLQKIAPRYNLSWEYLARLNRVRPERIKVGQKLKVVPGPFSAFVDLSDFSLTVHAQGYFVKRYAIGIGADNSTPIGTFSVKKKLKNPTYYGPDGVIDADDPNNPLGERWIDIGDSYGIHGTIDPKSIGKAESRGCLRLNNEDVVEVYDFLTKGSEVVIRP